MPDSGAGRSISIRCSDALADIGILYIVGSGRTGSTILGQILNARPGVFFGGELIDFWRRGIEENRLCACGQRARDCEVWGSVIETLSDHLSAADLAEMVRLRSEISLLERVSRSVSPWDLRQRSAFPRRFADATEQLYRAIRDTTGSNLIVDSSKFTYYALALLAIPSVDLRLLHLVRDPRAVAHSWSREVAIPDPEHDLHMPRYGPVGSTMRWLARNLSAAHLGSRLPARYLQLRYEDFIRDPAGELAAMEKALGLKRAGLYQQAGSPSEIPVNHAIWGNPGRFKSGEVRLEMDEAWRWNQPAVDRWVVWAMTAPWLSRFGYR